VEEGAEEGTGKSGRHGPGADNLSASNLARGRFVYRLSDDTFRRYQSHPIPNDFPHRAAPPSARSFYGRRRGLDEGEGEGGEGAGGKAGVLSCARTENVGRKMSAGCPPSAPPPPARSRNLRRVNIIMIITPDTKTE